MERPETTSCMLELCTGLLAWVHARTREVRGSREHLGSRPNPPPAPPSHRRQMPEATRSSA